MKPTPAICFAADVKQSKLMEKEHLSNFNINNLPSIILSELYRVL
ncbi:hypothetical protein [Bacillus alveayuensis]|jgi:hypothetical protein|nr:hypothetical protein [Bacillus alveayuensis]